MLLLTRILHLLLTPLMLYLLLFNLLSALTLDFFHSACLGVLPLLACLCLRLLLLTTAAVMALPI